MQNHTTMKTILASRVKEEVNDWLSTGKRLIPILFLLLLGVGNVWGGVSGGGYVYLDASGWDTTKITQLAVVWTTDKADIWMYPASGASMTHLRGTYLYYYHGSSSRWYDSSNYMRFFQGAGGAYNDYNGKIGELTGNGNYTPSFSYGINNNDTYFFGRASTSATAAIKTSSPYGYKGDNTAYTGINGVGTQSVAVKISTNGGSTWIDPTSTYTVPQAISLKTWKVTAQGTTTQQSTSIAKSQYATKSASIASANVAYTAVTTLSLTGSINSNYVFDGWYVDGSRVSTSSTYSYEATAAKSVEARFIYETTYTITIANSVNGTTSTQSVGATPVQITAPDIDGYTFSSWSTMPSGVTITSGNLTDKSIYITATKAAIVTANYNAKTKVRLYYTNPGNFSAPKAYFWYSTTTSDNSGWPGITMSSVTECGTTYYYAEYYKEDHPNWNRVIFNDNGNSETQTSDITFNNTTNNNQYNNAPASKSGTGSWSATLPAKWALAGTMNSWSTSSKTLTCDGGTFYVDVTLSANTEYSFKFYDTYSDTWYGVDGTVTKITYTNKATARAMTNTDGGSPDQTMTSAGAGTYRFTWDITNKTVTVTYPTSYIVTFDVGTLKGNSRTITAYEYGHYGESAYKINSGDYVTTGTQVQFYAGAVDAADVAKAGYGWKGFYGNAAGSEPQLAYTTAYSPYITTNTTVYACFYEIDYNVFVASSDATNAGTVAQSYMTAHVSTKATIPTATAKTGFYFVNWTETGTATLYSSTSATAAQINGVTANDAVTVTANFTPKWSVAGIGSWSTTANKFSTAYYQESSKWKGDKTIVLDANTDYEIKAYDLQNSQWYGTDHSAAAVDVYYANSGTAKSMSDTDGAAKNLQIHSAAGGSYTFKWNVTDKSMQIQYPTSWFITSGQKTEGQDDNAGGSFTAVDDSSNDVKGGKFVAHNASVTFTATPNTGYNFSGWWSDAACTSSQYTAGTDVEIDGNAMTLSSIAADKTVYAKFAPKTYTVTLTQTGAASTGTPSVTASYNTTAPAIAALPTAAQGYAFMGYYTAADGEGSQLVAANGTWQNVAGYTSGGKWIRDGGAELFAYFKKGAISALTLDAAIVAQGNTVGITPTLDPVPVGDKVICWRVLHGNGNPLDDQPAFSWDGTKVTFPASTNSGTYLAEAILRKGTTCGGEVLDSVTVSFQVAGDHTVTVQYKCGDDFIQASTSVTGKPLEWTSITAPNIFGYTFSKWKAGDGITIQDADGSGEKASATINFKATYEGKLTAIYTQKQLIYFKNTLGWSDVYVNFYTGSYWNNPKGSGNKGVTNSNKHMTRLDDTDIWYYDYGAASITPSLYVSFTSAPQTNAENFWASNPGVNVVYPANYQDDIHTNKSSENGFKAATPMFVPIAGQTATVLNSVNYGKANYFNRGYWVQYTPGTGYTLEIYNSAGNQLLKSVAFTSDGDLMPMEATVDLEAGQTYKYQLRRGGESAAGVYYGNSNTMAYNNCTGWEMINTMSPSFSKAGITANAAGDYKFTLSYAENNSHQYRLRMTVKYPVSMGDFRIVYSDNDTWSRGVAHTLGTWIMKSHTITARANGIDTVSFFISKGHSPEIRWEKATSQSGTAITWGTTGSWLTTGYTDVSESAVYNFKVTQDANGTAISSIERIGKYTGDYYIRVDCANSKWDNYTVDPDHRMTYSEYSIDHGGYSHYYCHWVQTDDRKNVKFCIANDYSPSISDTLTREVASGEWANIGSFIDAGGNILRNANVRFMWNQSTNKISRAYIDGAQGTGSDNFLKMLSSDSKIKDLSGTTKTEVYFQDNENWIYETNIQAQPNAQYKLVSNWGTSPVITQYFKGSSTTTETLITGSGDIWYVIRVIYDFKTNRILAAWMPEGELEEAKEINADVMFIREHQGDINQLILNEEGEISKINTAYGVMRFNKWTINNKEKTGEHNPLASPASIYERSLYWVSFPFRVKLSEVFGFGTYGTHWILQYYDGAERAEKGMWAETGSYWKFIWDRKDFILEPNTGYLLTLETELMGVESSVWGPGSKANQVELFFPSYGTMPDITQDNVVIPLEEHTCTINRSGGNLPGGNDYRTTYDRRIVDSHWNVMGVPTYVNTDDVTFPASEWTTNLPKFLYTWNADDNTITAASASGFTFHAMHAYMVQYYGNVTWSAHSGSPYPIVARSTYSEKPKEVEFCIELTQNETMLDRTFINLSDDETVSAGFAFNEDMTKEFSGNKPAIYTFIDTDVVAAGNTLPMSDQKTIVPLGVETKQAGDYTIAIPNGTNGVGVTLIDEETGVHTSLSALDYTVSLPAGKHDNRFFLEISPIKTTPTGIEDVQGGNVQSTKVHKVMIDGILYIVKDGKIFDARGARLR